MIKFIFTTAIIFAMLAIDNAQAAFFIPDGSITAAKLAFGVNQPTGSIQPYAGRTAPSGWLLAYGQDVSRTTYSTLYGIMCPQLGTFTVTIGSPGVFTLNSHGLRVGDRIRLFTTGGLPTGLSANSDFYVLSVLTSNTFTVSSTLGGAVVNTSGAQSGTHTAQFFGFGAGDGSTTFTLPDMRGRVAAGSDEIGGTAASRLTLAGSNVYGSAIGYGGGDQLMQAHSHTYGAQFLNQLQAGSNSASFSPGSSFSTSTSGSGNTQNVQPVTIVNYIVKY